MKRAILGVALASVCAASSAVSAQPGADPGQQQPMPPPPPPTGGYAQPPPLQYAPPAYGYQPQMQITPDEAELLRQGEIDSGTAVLGAAASLFLGFGAGQGIQGRWHETGWIFTLGETAAITALIIGAVDAAQHDCSFECTTAQRNDDHGAGLIITGAIGFGVLRIWEIGDALIGPGQHNQHVRELRQRLGVAPPPVYSVVPYVNTTRDGGGVAGFSLRF